MDINKNTYNVVIEKFPDVTQYIVRDDDNGEFISFDIDKHGKVRLEEFDGFPTSDAFKLAKVNYNKIMKNQKCYDERYLLVTLRDVDIDHDWYTIAELESFVPEKKRKIFNFALDKFELRYPIIEMNEKKITDKFINSKYHTIKFKSGKEIVARLVKKGTQREKIITKNFEYKPYTQRFKLSYNKIDPVLYNVSMGKGYNRNKINVEDIDKCSFIIPEDKEIMKDIHNSTQTRDKIDSGRNKFLDKKGVKYPKNEKQ